MNSRRHVRSNRRKFRATKSKVYRKSRRNARKIMRGGTPENIGTSTELDKTWFSRIDIEKTDNKDNLIKFKEERLSGIPKKNINDTYHEKIIIFASKKDDGDAIFNQIQDLAKQLLNEEAEIEAKNKKVTVMAM